MTVNLLVCVARVDSWQRGVPGCGAPVGSRRPHVQGLPHPVHTPQRQESLRHVFTVRSLCVTFSNVLTWGQLSGGSRNDMLLNSIPDTIFITLVQQYHSRYYFHNTLVQQHHTRHYFHNILVQQHHTRHYFHNILVQQHHTRYYFQQHTIGLYFYSSRK